jgi:hypothetical protein
LLSYWTTAFFGLAVKSFCRLLIVSFSLLVISSPVLVLRHMSGAQFS